MDRRAFMQTAVFGAIATGFAGNLAAAERFFPASVDQALFQGINRTKDPKAKTALEKSHAPVIIAPARVKVGEPFSVEVSVGETLHTMGPAHWIEYVELNVGNEPAGRAELQPKGYLKPRVVFTVVLTKDAAPAGKVTLVGRQHCNLHGLWEGNLDLVVV